ncbi:MAG: calcium-binding protein [Pseudomonadota bacterium]|nr:calcium-binding protein [Pseudomonadota bacterium]MDP1572677.1 calcium-binding protein [Pseudomonadota bacterium]MDP1906550.1 calcium-binding protein [Pseudomonadota bacterium]
MQVDLATGLGTGGDAEGDTLAGIENLTGSAWDDTLTGDAGNNSLAGNAGNDRLVGGAGNDTLTGGAGADWLDGGTGLDRANYAASASAVLLDLSAGTAAGGDAEGDVLTGIENLTGSAWDDTLVGDAGNNSLAGNAGNDSLVGGGGNDTLSGGLGDDLLAGGEGNDALTGGAGADQLDGGIGNDSASYSASTAAVQVDLATGLGTGGDAEGDTLAGIENLTGSAWDDTLIGNALANYLAGNTGHDSLMGGDGNDVLNGGRGNDQLSGGAGKDIFRFADLLDSSENLDTILDFNSADDTIQLELDIFAMLGHTGKLSAANFSGTGAAMDADDYIVYDSTTGSLSYDSDGSGGMAAIQFATLLSPAGLVVGDFVVI